MVFSNRGGDPQPFWLMDSEFRQLAVRNGVITLHFVYLATTPAEIAREVIETTMSAHRTFGE